MIGLDSNVLIRYVVQDDPDQAATASALIDGLTEVEPGFVSTVTVAEVYWVLRRAYRLDAGRCASVIAGLLDSREIRVDRADVVHRAVAASRSGAGFADALIAELGRAAGCSNTVTFDNATAHHGIMRLIGS